MVGKSRDKVDTKWCQKLVEALAIRVLETIEIAAISEKSPGERKGQFCPSGQCSMDILVAPTLILSTVHVPQVLVCFGFKRDTTPASYLLMEVLAAIC